VQDFPEDKWDDIIAVCLNSAFHTTKAVIPHMLDQVERREQAAAATTLHGSQTKDLWTVSTGVAAVASVFPPCTGAACIKASLCHPVSSKLLKHREMQ
jgi:NAD(P)-dependent dehydrogenase (short-subunit alcohol dehydrogenase family)